jgi:hypothetical protein
MCFVREWILSIEKKIFEEIMWNIDHWIITIKQYLHLKEIEGRFFLKKNKRDLLQEQALKICILRKEIAKDEGEHPT